MCAQKKHNKTKRWISNHQPPTTATRCLSPEKLILSLMPCHHACADPGVAGQSAHPLKPQQRPWQATALQAMVCAHREAAPTPALSLIHQPLHTKKESQPDTHCRWPDPATGWAPCAASQIPPTLPRVSISPPECSTRSDARAAGVVGMTLADGGVGISCDDKGVIGAGAGAALRLSLVTTTAGGGGFFSETAGAPRPDAAAGVTGARAGVGVTAGGGGGGCNAGEHTRQTRTDRRHARAGEQATGPHHIRDWQTHCPTLTRCQTRIQTRCPTRSRTTLRQRVPAEWLEVDAHWQP
jgi:hypothetical protein